MMLLCFQSIFVRYTKTFQILLTMGNRNNQKIIKLDRQVSRESNRTDQVCCIMYFFRKLSYNFSVLEFCNTFLPKLLNEIKPHRLVFNILFVCLFWSDSVQGRKVVILKTLFQCTGLYFRVTDFVVVTLNFQWLILKTTLLCILYIHTQFSSVFVSIAGTSELVMLSLDLVKTRLAVMSMEMRKNFIQAILTSLIEKSTDAKILRAVVKIVEEWVKNNSPMAANQVN